MKVALWIVGFVLVTFVSYCSVQIISAPRVEPPQFIIQGEPATDFHEACLHGVVYYFAGYGGVVLMRDREDRPLACALKPKVISPI